MNVAFVSSQTLQPGPNLVDTADSLCAELAAEAGLEGTFLAWVSGGGLDARDRLELGGVRARGWNGTTGLPFTDDIADLALGEIFYPLRFDEHGNPVGPETVLTGTFGNGGAGQNCQDWTATTADAQMHAGRVGETSERWTRAGLSDCDEAGHVYCFGVDNSEELVVDPVEGPLAFVSDEFALPNIGRDGFDNICQESAAAAGLSGVFQALVSTTDEPAASRFEASGGGWVNTLGVPITPEGTSLADTAVLMAGITFDASGNSVNAITWGGSSAAYLPAEQHSCNEWTVGTGDELGYFQYAGSTLDWYGLTVIPCSNSGRVLCLEQD